MPNPLLLCPPTQSLALEVAWSVINHNSSTERLEAAEERVEYQERYMMNWMMIGNRLKLWLFIARVVRVLAAITMTQYICRSVNTHTHTFLPSRALLLPQNICKCYQYFYSGHSMPGLRLSPSEWVVEWSSIISCVRDDERRICTSLS